MELGAVSFGLIVPLFVLTALAGALVGRRAWARARYATGAGAIIGGAAGLLGPLLFMVPLRFCTFEAERGGVDLALGVVAFAAGAAVAVLAATWAATTVSREGGRTKSPESQAAPGAFGGGLAMPLALLAPTLLVLVLFLYWPLVETMRLSTRLVRLGAPSQPFVCLDNFTKLMAPTATPTALGFTAGFVVAAAAVVILNLRGADRDVVEGARKARGVLGGVAIVVWAVNLFGPSYRGVFVTTLILSTGVVVLGLGAGLAVAYLVSKPIRGRGLYQTFVIWPYAISPPVAGIVFFVMFDPLAGLVANLLETITGLSLPNYRTDPMLARGLVVLASVWKMMGFNILFYIAGLQNVPNDILEAGQIDGANGWQRFRRLTLPSLSPITFFLIVTNLTYAFFEVFGTITYLTSGGPSRATTDAMFALMQAGREQGSFGDGAAQSLILFAMVLAVTAWQFRVTGRRVHYGA